MSEEPNQLEGAEPVHDSSACYEGTSRMQSTRASGSAPTPPDDRQLPVIKLVGITKRFGGVTAVENIEFDLYPGEVHALMGENGAGKSTLMKIIAGVHQPDEGLLQVDGEVTVIRDPRHAADQGIAMIPQELSLFPQLTVLENMYVGRQRPRRRGAFDIAGMKSEASALLLTLGVELDLDAPLRTLSVANQQLVDIARALLKRARVVIMDEPTAALSEREALRLGQVIAKLRLDGVAIIYISHRLKEIRRMADRVTVMRDGHYVTTVAARSVSEHDLVRLMVGRDLAHLYEREPHVPGPVRLELRAFDRTGDFEGINMTVRAGEIVGLAGLIGAGRSELAQAIFGIRRPTGGEVRIDDRPVRISTPSDAIGYGIGYVPEERLSEGLVLPFSIASNISFASLGRVSRGFQISLRRELALAKQFERALDIRGGRVQDQVSTLSGGNQQKVVLAKWLATQPSILILDEPTRGVDVGAKVEIYKLIDKLAEEGKAILLISSELEEVLAMSDRVLVMREGRITAELSKADANQESIMVAATGAES
jgi:rhamnose transport system ATP-binding protein